MEADSKVKTRLQFSDAEQGDVAIRRKPPKAAKVAVETTTQTSPRDAPSQQMTRTRLRFTEEELPPAPNPKVAKAAAKLGKAKARIPKRKALTLARAHDEATGKTEIRLSFEERAKKLPASHTFTGGPLMSEVHRQMGNVEEDNAGVQSAHEAEKGVEFASRLAAHSYRSHKLKPYRQMEKAQGRLDKANLRAFEDKANLSSNPISRWRQKRGIRQSYMTAKATGSTIWNQGAAQKTATLAQRTTQGIKQIFTRNKKTYVMGGLLFLLLALVMNGLSACTPLVQGALQSAVIATYPAEDADILAAERYYKGLENELQNQINSYAADHPQYDEFQYELDDIWHDPHALISLVSARMNGEWTIDEVYGTLDLLFQRQYTLSQEVTTQTRYRKEWVTHHYKQIDDETGEVTWVPYEVEEDVPYPYRICTLTLDNFDLSHLPFYVLSREGVGRYAMYISVLGNREDLFRGNPYASTLREPGKHDVPQEYLEDETFARLLWEAEKYIGYPYVWGGDSPETSFDCSGFVSYVFTNSGVRDVGRLGATSLYGRCRKITPEEARPGDLIFFQGTIPGETGITHVGIYVGDGWMLHCGSPIGYADLSESYWRNHYFGYGRLAQE